MRTKIEIAHLRRIGHVLRLPDDRLVKRMVLGWNAELEGLTKAKRRQQTTLSYWRKLLTDAAIPHENLQKSHRSQKMELRGQQSREVAENVRMSARTPEWWKSTSTRQRNTTRACDTFNH